DSWSIKFVPLADKASNLKASISKNTWLSKVEGVSIDSIEQVSIPSDIRKLLGGSTPQLRTLIQLGVMAGQGLRTGANQFFYVDLLQTGKITSYVSPSHKISSNPVRLSNRFLLPVLRKQAELPS